MSGSGSVTGMGRPAAGAMQRICPHLSGLITGAARHAPLGPRPCGHPFMGPGRGRAVPLGRTPHLALAPILPDRVTTKVGGS